MINGQNRLFLNKKQLLGTLKNLLGRANQQVTCSSRDQGTSETTREAVSLAQLSCVNINNFDFSAYESHKPEHIKHLDTAFLTWFIGFVEGDGSFWARDTNINNISTRFRFDSVTKRGEFEITQHIDNIKLLKLIRTKLGFGRIYSFEKEGRKYCRWYTSEKKNIIRLISILNGNLVLEKRRLQFKQWHTFLTTEWNLNIPLKTCNCNVSLQNGWLAGFSDADAGFYTNVGNKFKGNRKPNGEFYIKFSTKFYITQKGEENVLLDIRNLVGATNQLTTITNGTSSTQYNRLEISQENCIEILTNYFTKFPLKGVRKIDCLRWARVYAYKTRHVATTERAAEKLARLVLALQEPSTDLALNTFAHNFSDEENEIFSSLPLSQRNTNYQSRDPRRRYNRNNRTP